MIIMWVFSRNTLRFVCRACCWFWCFGVYIGEYRHITLVLTSRWTFILHICFSSPAYLAWTVLFIWVIRGLWFSFWVFRCTWAIRLPIIYSGAPIHTSSVPCRTVYQCTAIIIVYAWCTRHGSFNSIRGSCSYKGSACVIYYGLESLASAIIIKN